MGESRCPGPVCGSRGGSADDGTMVLRTSNLPGSTGLAGLIASGAAGTPGATNVYRIEPTTGLARAMLRHEVLAACGEAGVVAKVDSKACYILHGGHLANASQDTVDKINTPAKCEALVALAVRKLQADAAALGGVFPAGYSEVFAKAVIEGAIALAPAKPDEGVVLAGERFGAELVDTPATLPAYHIYEAIAASGGGGYDKVQHFVRSAVMQYRRGGTMTDLAQYAKETRDEVQSWFGPKKGFDWSDMKANNRGQAYGDKLHEKYHPVRHYLRNLD